MKFLLDTNALLWVTQEPDRLSRAAHKALQSSAENGRLSLAAISLYEISRAVARGRLHVDRPTDIYLRFVEASFNILPLTVAIAMRAAQFGERYPSDPGDQIIGATAVVHGMTLMTADWAIRASGEVPCIW